ncbi:hypothetical protein BX600DRAFT_505436 [Xylariales sp. PMI_506]|nr:hypothetical protein BX600DRAFT_505436 [Xylariales sp. PMI_506]
MRYTKTSLHDPEEDDSSYDTTSVLNSHQRSPHYTSPTPSQTYSAITSPSVQQVYYDSSHDIYQPSNISTSATGGQCTNSVSQPLQNAYYYDPSEHVYNAKNNQASATEAQYTITTQQPSQNVVYYDPSGHIYTLNNLQPGVSGSQYANTVQEPVQNIYYFDPSTYAHSTQNIYPQAVGAQYTQQTTENIHYCEPLALNEHTYNDSQPQYVAASSQASENQIDNESSGLASQQNSRVPVNEKIITSAKSFEIHHPYEDVAAPLVHTSPLDPEKQKQVAPETRKPFATLRFYLLNTYRRLFGLTMIANTSVFIIIMCGDQKLLSFVDAFAINLTACGLSRQPLVVNALFRLFTSLPRSTPLRIRHLCCKIFHLGGVHSSTGFAAILWYLGFLGLYTKEYRQIPQPTTVYTTVLVLGYLVAFVLMAVIVSATPIIRAKWHDWFERIHRFGCWLSLALLWSFVLTLSSQQQKSMGSFLVSLPAFWSLIITTIAIIQPWLKLRRVKVIPEPLSDHAIRLHFNHTMTLFGQGISISKHPLRDWHSFAGISDRFDSPLTKFSCVISKAGDWTTSVINTPPTHLWVRGMPVYGFGYVMRLFKRVIIVTTGSGVGPCLSALDYKDRPEMRLVWQTKSPLKTYTQRTLDLVKGLDQNAVIIDSSTGRQDMLPIVLELQQEFNAEAYKAVAQIGMVGRMHAKEEWLEPVVQLTV